MAAGAASAVVDVAAYGLLVSLVFGRLNLVDRLMLSAVLARILSSLFNYLCNRRLPQMRRKAFWPTAARYYVLWVFQLAGSVLGTWALCTAFWRKRAAGKICRRHSAQPAQLSGAAALGVRPGKGEGGCIAARRVLGRCSGWRAGARRGTPAPAPAVYVVHHQNMAGPSRCGASSS